MSLTLQGRISTQGTGALNRVLPSSLVILSHLTAFTSMLEVKA